MKTFYYWIRSIVRRLIGYGIEIYEVVPCLYQASQFNEKDIEKIKERGITLIIDLTEGIDPPLGVETINFWFEDKAELPDLKRLHEVAEYGYRHLCGMENALNKVMTHCTLGKNRSGLVNGLILVKMGMTGKKAVKLIQAKVPGSLFNDTFREYLEDYEDLYSVWS